MEDFLEDFFRNDGSAYTYGQARGKAPEPTQAKKQAEDDEPYENFDAKMVGEDPDGECDEDEDKYDLADWGGKDESGDDSRDDLAKSQVAAPGTAEPDMGDELLGELTALFAATPEPATTDEPVKENRPKVTDVAREGSV